MEINIAQRLKDLRKQFNVTQEKVAASISIKRSLYAAYEEGRAEPRIETLIALCRFYGFETINEILGVSSLNNQKHSKLLDAYYRSAPDIRKIVDFVLNLNY